MMPYFIWKNKNSHGDFGLWISKLPKITRPKERYSTIDVPGRAGSLIMLEGDDVYESYQKDITIQTTNWNPRIDEMKEWLSGKGDLIICTESDRVYEARIVGEVSFERIGNNLVQAKIPFFCEPFKKNRYEASDSITLTANGTITNKGNVASKPRVSITGSGSNVSVTIAGQTMTFNSLTGTIVVDCDAHMITQGTSLWTGTFTGEFWKIPTGQSTVTTAVSITIEPRWRWK